MPRKRKTPLPTVASVLASLRYERETGRFFLLKGSSKKRAGDQAGTIDVGGYRRLKINGIIYAAHHIVWLLEKGYYPNREVQQINGNRDDAHIDNLRMNNDVRDELTLDLVKQHVDYDPETGIFTWKVRKGRQAKPGDIAGSVDVDQGYVIMSIAGNRLKGHRLAWFYMTGEWPNGEIDHRNGKRDDNRWDNLREATDLQNAQNASLRSDNSSGIKGVFYHKKTGKWSAKINVSRRCYHLGHYATREEAAEARRLAEAEHFGEFMRSAA